MKTYDDDEIVEKMVRKSAGDTGSPDVGDTDCYYAMLAGQGPFEVDWESLYPSGTF